MTERVDFYVLGSRAARQRWTFACRLTEKAYLRDLRVVVLSESAADVEALDELLWTFNERSFVPHEITRTAHVAVAATDAVAAAVAVQLTANLDSIGSADLLVNLSERLPARLERFGRIAEIIDSDDARRQLGRERFKAYRDLQLTVETHQLDDASAG